MLAAGTWVLLVAATAFTICYAAITLFYRKRRQGEPPLVKGSMVWGNAVDFNEHAVKFLHQSTKTYGNVFTIRLINQFLTIVMDPHSFESLAKERNFDFDPIQKQVNWNVFSFVLIDPKKMVKDAVRNIRGKRLENGVKQFAQHLEDSCDLSAPQGDEEWSTCGLRNLASKTMFDAIFKSVFGRADGHDFNSAMAHKNFDIFHKYFNYFWLGMPKCLFPEAMKSLTELLVMPGSNDLLSRPDLSDYLRSSMEFMLEKGQTETDIKAHNLVYLHVNYNTFRVAFWLLNNLLEYPEATVALRKEVQEATEQHWDDESNSAVFTMKQVENLALINSFVNETIRLSSGVFMVRYINQDTEFTTSDGKTHIMRKGDRVAMYPPALHKDPEIFEDPLVFKYDRFVDAKFYKYGKELKHPIMAFGSLCPGQRYAMFQLKWYLMVMLTRFDLVRPDGVQQAEYDYQYHGHEVLPPVSDINVDVRLRKDPSKLRLSE